MTSTNVFSGFNQDKNSSKVSKPPGGGHTDIFGAPDLPVRPNSGRNTSSILEGTNRINETNKATSAAAAASPAEKSKPKVSDMSSPKAEPQKRNRVPPGGFSSGPLW